MNQLHSKFKVNIFSSPKRELVLVSKQNSEPNLLNPHNPRFSCEKGPVLH